MPTYRMRVLPMDLAASIAATFSGAPAHAPYNGNSTSQPSAPPRLAKPADDRRREQRAKAGHCRPPARSDLEDLGRRDPFWVAKSLGHDQDAPQGDREQHA